ncbi:type II toxin-antitoxin system RelE/ParE family toxin [bacterium]|nr:type II toxin-antitoxin system RelE/ParE family toxin [bacterium]
MRKILSKPRNKKKHAMPIKFHPTARCQLIEIWRYTEKTWNEKQADTYIRGLYQAMENASKHHFMWRPVMHDALKGVFFIRHKKHYIFFRELSNGELGILSVLHECMDIPSRLKEIDEEG